jgi:hypothetical protein
VLATKNSRAMNGAATMARLPNGTRISQIACIGKDKFSTRGPIDSLSIGRGKIQKDNIEKDPLSTTPNVILDQVVSILGMGIGRLLVGGRWLDGGRKSI